MGGGAWPFLVGGAICLVNSVNERDLSLLTSYVEEFLVSASHQLALTTSLPFVHTARRSYRLNGPVKCSDCGDVGGEPAEGSLSIPRNERDPSERAAHDAPRRRGCGRVQNARRIPSPRVRDRRQRAQRQRPATVRDANTRTTTRRDLCQAKEEARGGPTSNTVKGTPAWASRPTCSPPTPCPAAPPRAVRRVVGGEQIGRPCPPWRDWLKNTLPQGHFVTTSGGSAPPGPAWLEVVSEAQAQKRTPAGSRLRDWRPCSDCDPRSVLCDGPGASPMEWGAREGDSPVVPGPCRTARHCRRVGLFGNAAQIGREADGGRRCASVVCGTARAGPPLDSGRRPTRVTGGTSARADDPARGYVVSVTEEGGARPHGHALVAPARSWHRPAGSPFDPS
ncbi:hypothetical protein H6P81_015976 [Aristolochia fimbriata]|uniref:Uncharacterized protein n=1 Tax=Aristolochia fimbriata TaxID=158543 RepID=A0AAV7E895_ARIFI|nr:hypothetical protein H6P81_015976 [Aristolochia fimbriata]